MSLEGTCITCPGGVRHEGGVTLIQAYVWNVGTFALMEREKFKWRHHENESTEAGHKGRITP